MCVCGLQLPVTAEALIERHDRQPFGQLRLGQRQFRGKELAFGVQHLQEAGDAALVPFVGQAQRVPPRPGQRLLLDAELPSLAIFHQRIGDLAEGQLDRLQVAPEGGLLLSLSGCDTGAYLPGIEDGRGE
jgi:hypothetical protein